MVRVRIGVQETYRDRFDTHFRQALTSRCNLIFVEGQMNVARAGHALVDFKYALARYQRRWAYRLDVIEDRPIAASHHQHIAEPPRGDDTQFGAVHLQRRVGRDGHAVRDIRDVAGRGAR